MNTIKKKLTFKEILFLTSIMLIEVFVYLSNDMYLGSLDSIKDALKIGSTEISYTMSAWFVGFATMPIISGIASRYFSKKNIFIFGSILFIFANLLAPQSKELNTLLISRFLQGSCASFTVVIGYSIIHEMYSGSLVMYIISVMNSISIIAPAFGPILGAFIVKFASWKWIFWTLSIGGILSLALTCFSIPYSKVLNKTEKKPKLKRILTDYLKILSNPIFGKFLIIYALVFSASLFWVLSSPFLIVEILGKSGIEFGVIQAIIFSGFYIGSFILKTLINLNKSTYKIILSGLMISTVNAIIILILCIKNVNFYYIIPILMLFVSGCNVSLSPLNRIIVNTNHNLISQSSSLLSSSIGISGAMFGMLLPVIVKFGFICFSEIILLTSTISLLSFLIFIKESETENV